ncbi:MAG: putative DNA binding CopG/RHH family protein, partial [Gammaproteobacteria bacterium]
MPQSRQDRKVVQNVISLDFLLWVDVVNSSSVSSAKWCSKLLKMLIHQTKMRINQLLGKFMLRIIKNRFARTGLNYFSFIHYHHFV